MPWRYRRNSRPRASHDISRPACGSPRPLPCLDMSTQQSTDWDAVPDLRMGVSAAGCLLVQTGLHSSRRASVFYFLDQDLITVSLEAETCPRTSWKEPAGNNPARGLLAAASPLRSPARVHTPIPLCSSSACCQGVKRMLNPNTGGDVTGHDCPPGTRSQATPSAR